MAVVSQATGDTWRYFFAERVTATVTDCFDATPNQYTPPDLHLTSSCTATWTQGAEQKKGEVEGVAFGTYDEGDSFRGLPIGDAIRPGGTRPPWDVLALLAGVLGYLALVGYRVQQMHNRRHPWIDLEPVPHGELRVIGTWLGLPLILLGIGLLIPHGSRLSGLCVLLLGFLVFGLVVPRLLSYADEPGTR